MAAPILYKVKSATFKTKAIKQAVTMTMQVTGAEQMARGDGAIANTIAYVEGTHVRVSIQALEGDVNDVDLQLPGAGSLVVVCFQQAPGSGDAASDITITFPEATFGGVSRGAPLDGNPTVDFPFVAVAASGDPADLFAVT